MDLGASVEGPGKSRPRGLRTPNRPARNDSLHRLRYRGAFIVGVTSYLKLIENMDPISINVYPLFLEQNFSLPWYSD
jgi:hypothetical protein